jgi:uncharacterized circularly permuted ATP-grasp superfamily protein/uncharacterized alpha-E superfamily protein
MTGKCEVVAGGVDELHDPPVTPHQHWNGVAAALERLGPEELSARSENAQRLIREHGVTFNAHGDAQSAARAWTLDLMPLLISPRDWNAIETALVQRSRLMNLILEDVYAGGQRLLRDGFLPPQLVYANPGFLRPCRGIQAPRNVFLHLYACDFARSTDGHWWAVEDRAQTPSGLGYALENRTVISRVMGEEMRQQDVRRLAGFFRTEREMLFQLAPGQRNNPKVVLLTPGPLSETYFEHAYLARHLGFPLVEGADLTVRDRRVFLKTLEGLEPVDVILRRVMDSYCDPLELYAGSFLGVAGLVEAARAGNVTLANALGTGLVESPALLAFLPGLCRHLLAEELRMPSVATWWCGQSDELCYVLDHIEQLVVTRAFGSPASQPWVGARMSRTEKDGLRAAIQARPEEFVGQESLELSHAPAWLDNRFQSRPIQLRAYAACSGETNAVMPGALARVSRALDDSWLSMQNGGVSKDTWVLEMGEGARTNEAGLAVPDLRPAERTLSGTPSRAADNLYWLGRYTERLEQTLRILRCICAGLVEEQDGSFDLQTICALLVSLKLEPAGQLSGFTERDLQRRLLKLVYQAGHPDGVQALLARIRTAASAVRDRFSGDTWRILGRLNTDGRARPGRLPLASAAALIHNLILDLAALNGVASENMTRGHGWRFLDAGRRVERGLSIVRLVRATVAASSPDAALMQAVLEIADSVMTYRRRYFAEPRLAEVIELLLCDETNPRSLAFQVNELRNHSGLLPQLPKTSGLPSAERRINTMLAALHDSVVSVARNHEHPREPLIKWLDSLSSELGVFSDALTGCYFSHTIPRVR